MLMFDREEGGASEVIGFLVLAGLFIAVAGLIAVTLLSGMDNDQTPAVVIKSGGIDEGGQKILILSHEGGDLLSKDKLAIYVEGVDRTDDFKDESGSLNWDSWDTGAVLYLDVDEMPENILVVSYQNPEEPTVIYILGEGTGSPIVVPTIVPTPTPGPDTPPSAQFNGTPLSGGSPLTVSFTDLSTSSPEFWLWDFGDGSNSTEQNPVHVYYSFGVYTVSLQASNGAGSDTETKTAYVAVIPSLSCENAGLNGYYYDGIAFSGSSVSRSDERLLFADEAANTSSSHFPTDMLNWPVPVIGDAEAFSVMYEGYLIIDIEEDYTFYLTSDDGSRLWIDNTDDSDTPAIDNWDLHSATTVSSTVHLSEGYHPVKVKMYENSGLAVLQLEWESANISREYVSSFCRNDSCSQPRADFESDIQVGNAPLVVTFSDLSTGDPLSWLWDFGDGTNSTEQNPVHTYESRGKYNVSLTASNIYGSGIKVKTEYINVLTDLPCQNTGLIGTYFNRVDFTGDSFARTDTRLRFADDEAASEYGYASDISNWPEPIAGITDLFSVIYEGYIVIDTEDNYTFYLTSDDGSRLWIDNTDDSDTPVVDNWGDHVPSMESAAIHLTEGYHPVKVRMYERYGNAVLYLEWSSSQFSRQFTESFIQDDICGPAPVAEFSASPLTGTAPLSVIFLDNSTGSPTSWLWDFGDGYNSTEQNPVHIYSYAGLYDVSLKASNTNGFDYENKTEYITVTGFPNPAAWWRFDEASGSTAYDSSGNNNDGDIYGSYSWDTGACDGAIYFDGTSTYVRVDDSDTLDAPEYITYAAWLKPEPPVIPSGMASTYNNYTSLIDKGSNDHDNYEFFIRRLGGTSQFSFETSTNGGTYREYSTTGLTYNYGEWQHIAFVVDTDAQTAKVYVNGQNTATISSIQSYLPVRDQDLTIGRQQMNNYLYYFYYKGYMDEVMLFTDALTDEQVLAIYDTCTPPVTVPVAEFTANQTEGETPFSVSFTDLSTGSPTSWKWDFGDGYNSTEQNPVHTYTSAGSYTVSLSASNSAGSDTEIKTDYITVNISFAEYIVSENVFVYGSQLSMDGRAITGEGSTIVIQDGGLKNSDLDGGTRIAVSNIYIDGPVTLIGQNGALGSPVSPGIIAVNGNVYLSYFGSIYGDLYIDGDLTLLGNTINGDIYVNGDLTLYDSFPSFGSADSKIYYTGALSCPVWWDSSKRSRFVKVDSVPVVGMPDMEIPSAKESDWYTSRGYVSGGTLESNMKIFANRYSSDFSSDARNIIVVAETGDINLDSGDYGTVTGVLFAPNGKVTFQGFAFEGVVIAKDGFFVKDGGTRVIFKNMDQYIVNPEDYPF